MFEGVRQGGRRRALLNAGRKATSKPPIWSFEVALAEERVYTERAVPIPDFFRRKATNRPPIPISAHVLGSGASATVT